eukprot:COSAG01_NODE_1441_length_10293_cov_4.232392_7_plen_66_part_00
MMAEPLKEVLFDKIMKMSCWSKLRLDTLPYWSQIEVCMHLRPLTVRCHPRGAQWGVSWGRGGCLG